MSIFRFSTGRNTGSFNGYVCSHACDNASPKSIRGGRLRKTSKGLASFAPFLFSASVLALGGLLSMATPAEAGTCTDQGGANSINGQRFICRGAANSASDATRTINSSFANFDLSVTDDATFGLDVSSGIGLDIGSSGTNNDAMTIDLDGNIKAGGTAIDVDQNGTGFVTVETDGTLTSTSGEGIVIVTESRTNGAVTVRATAAITAGRDAISINHRGTGAINVTAADITGGSGGVEIVQGGTGGDVTVMAKGTVSATSDQGISVDQDSAGAVNITAEGNLTSTNEEGILVTTVAATTGMIEVTANGRVKAGKDGINVNHDGTSAIVITSSDTIESSNFGIVVDTASATTGNVNITANNVTASNNDGVFFNNSGSGAVDVTITGDVMASGEGINAIQNGEGNTEVTVNSGASVASSADEGIYVKTRDSVTTGNVTLDINGNVSGANQGILVNNAGTGDVTITVAAEVTGSGGTAIDLDGAGSHMLILNEGASLAGSIDASGVTGTSTLMVSGEVDGLGDVMGFDDVDIQQSGSLEITGAQIWSTDLTLSGRLALTGADSSLGFQALTLSGNVEVDVDVDFSGGDGSLTVARLYTSEVSGGSVTINVRAVGGFPEIDENDEDGVISIENFIQARTASANDFRAGEALDNGRFTFDIVHVSGGFNQWTLVATPVADSGGGGGGGGVPLVPGSIEEALFESFPAALAQLASVQSYQQRIRGKTTASNTKGAGVWGKASRSSQEVEPRSTALATFDLDNTMVQFGVEMPLHKSFTFGAGIGFSDATTDVAVPGASADIDTDAIMAGINANWKRDRIYLDTQLQYATFDNTIKLQETQVASPDADAIAVGVELGYAMELGELSLGLGDVTGGVLGGFGDLGGITLTPFAQLAWTSVDFDDLADAASLDDGDVLFGRVGASVASEYVYGSASLQIPLDGETGAEVNGTTFTSEIEDIAIDVGAGFTYPLTGNGMTLNGAVETSQGGETEAYSASLAVRFNF